MQLRPGIPGRSCDFIQYKNSEDKVNNIKVKNVKMNKILVVVLFISTFVLAQSNSQLIDIGEGGVSWVSKNGQYVCGSNWPNPPFIWSEATGRVQIGLVEGEVLFSFK